MSKSESSQSPSSLKGFHPSHLGKYTIGKRLGAGGMGTVFLATDDSLKRTVALKILKKEQAENPTLVRRFHAEGQAAAVLEHKNIVRVYDAGKADGYLYIALEYVDGIDVLQWINNRGPVQLKRSIDIIRQVAAALEHAQSKHIVHRDIKPSNLMITKDGTVKLADMGLARSIDETLDTSITRDGTTVGTVDYMPPEQAANSKAADIRSDIYSLGCTWYHMLTGRLPFPDGSVHNKLSAHLKTPPPDPRELNPDVTEGVVAVIHRMMSKAPEQRHQTASELLADLDVEQLTRAGTPTNLLAMLTEEDDVPDDPSLVNDDWAALSQDASEAPATTESNPDTPNPDTRSNSKSRSKKTRKKPSQQQSKPEGVPRKKKAKRRDVPTEDQKSTPSNSSTSKPKEARSQAADSVDSPAPSQRKKRTTPPTSPEQEAKPASEPTAASASPSSTTPTSTTPASPTTPAVPTSMKRKSNDQKKTKSKSASRRSSASENSDAPDVQSPPESRTPLLETPTEPAPPQTAKQPKRSKASKHTKPPQRTEPEARAVPPRELPQRTDEKPDDSSTKDSAGVEIDFTRIGIVAAVVLAIGVAIWWVANQGGGVSDPGSSTDPYSSQIETNGTDPENDTVELKPPADDSDARIDVIVANNANSTNADPQSANSSTPRKRTVQVLPPWLKEGWSLPSPLATWTPIGRSAKSGGGQPVDLDSALNQQREPVKNLELQNTTVHWPSPLTMKKTSHLTIRALEGTSPVIAIGESQLKNSKWLSFHGDTLIFEGIHFVLHLTESRQKPVTLIELTGPNLVIRDCTVTVIGDGNVPVNVVESIGSTSENTRVLLEQVHFRGKKLTAVQLRSGKGDLILKDSLVVSGDAPVVQLNRDSSTNPPAHIRLIASSLFSNHSIVNAERETASRQTSPEIEVIVRDSFLANQDGRPGTAFQFSEWAVPPSAQEPALFDGLVNMSIAESKLSGWSSLVDATSGAGNIVSAQSAEEWNALWQNKLRSESIVKHAPNDLVTSQSTTELDDDQPAIGCDARKLRWLPKPFAKRVELASVYFPLQPLHRDDRTFSKKTFDLKNAARLQEFIDSPGCPDGTHLVLSGEGLVSFPKIRLTNRNLRFELKSDISTSLALKGLAPSPAVIQPPFQMKGTSLFQISGGHIEFINTEFDLTKSNSCTLFSIRDDADVSLNGTIVRLQAKGKNIPALIDCHSVKSILVSNSTLEGDRILFRVSGSCDRFQIQNSLLLSEADAISIDAHEAFGPVLMSTSTVFATGAAFRIHREPQFRPIDVVLYESLFLGSHLDQSSDNLLLVDNEESLTHSINWIETRCGFETQAAMNLAYVESAIQKDDALKWRNDPSHWRVVDDISGPKLVFRIPTNSGATRSDLSGFQLDQSCPAATWSRLGGSIGADFQSLYSHSFKGRMKRINPRVRPKL